MLLDVDVVSQEFWTMITRMNATLEPRHFAYQFTNRLREDFQDQIDESFATESAAGGGAWPALSEWRAQARGSRNPILIDSGGLREEASLYRGVVRIISQGFSFNFPDTREMTGHAWGIFAGQLVNPLGALPLAFVPRRVLGGRPKQERSSVESLIHYFRAEGWEVSIE